MFANIRLKVQLQCFIEPVSDSEDISGPDIPMPYVFNRSEKVKETSADYELLLTIKIFCQVYGLQ